MKRIGILSDTHGLLREEVKVYLQECDVILHAGDINSETILNELNRIAPTFPVRGNADKEWAKDIPVTRSEEINGIRIFMIHNKGQIREDLSTFDLVIYGHSHKYEEKEAEKKKWLNPGSCGPRRFHLPITMAVLTVEEDGTFYIERIDIPHPETKPKTRIEDSKDSMETDLDDDMGDPGNAICAARVKTCIPAVIKEINKGTPVEKIAKKFKLPKDLAEQICRLYLTHPGVDADGIMAKMGL